MIAAQSFVCMSVVLFCIHQMKLVNFHNDCHIDSTVNIVPDVIVISIVIIIIQ